MNSLGNKLLFLSPQNPYPPIDGGKIGIYFPLKYLSKYFKIYLFFPVDENNCIKDINLITEHFKLFNITVYPIKIVKNDLLSLIKNPFKRTPFKWDKYFSRRALFILNKIIKEEDIKIIWVSSPHMGNYAIELKKNNDVKIFLREHNIEFKLVEQFTKFSRNPIFKTIANWQYKKTLRMERKYWGLFDKVFFISDLDYQIAIDLKPHLRENFILLYDGYEVPEIIREKNDSNLINGFIYPANLSTYQNLISFKWFMKTIWSPNCKILKDLDIKLFITGNNDDKINQIIKKKFWNIYNIINIGFVNDIDREIMKYKYVLAPTIIGSGIRLKILNGMACGKVVFTTDLDMSTSCKFVDMYNIVSFNSPENFIEKLLILERNEDMYTNICNNSINSIKSNFNWHNYADNVKEILDDNQK